MSNLRLHTYSDQWSLYLPTSTESWWTMRCTTYGHSHSHALLTGVNPLHTVLS